MEGFQAKKGVICVIIIGKYNEFAPDMGFPSIKEHIQKEPHKSKDAILKHLRNGNVHMVTASRIVDVFSGETTNIELVFMNDGKYSWSSKIPYYVDKYNLRLPKDFEDHILKN